MFSFEHGSGARWPVAFGGLPAFLQQTRRDGPRVLVHGVGGENDDRACRGGDCGQSQEQVRKENRAGCQDHGREDREARVENQ